MAGLTEEKFEQKKAVLIERTALALGVSSEEAADLLSIPRQQSVRVNTLKISPEEARSALQELGVSATQVPWMHEGLTVSEGMSLIRDSELAANGEVYIQNAASWLPVLALSPQPGQAILDMCAAPGGKTSHIAQVTSNASQLTANDNSRPRLHKLQQNLSRLGVESVDYTLHDATRLSYKLGSELFDAILLDAPCSGEGMMQLDSKKDFESWSVAHIKRLNQLQKKLIVQAWQLLKPGGTLVYSTCTIAPEENEAVIDYLLRHNDDARLEDLAGFRMTLPNVSAAVQQWNGKQYNPVIERTLRLHPSPQVEAFFVAKLTKTT
ncbi:MAG: RsmB/NOP family class I SAM-dependent RNA methyltransferase [Candidatus Microsaccharimonas sp.]